MATRNTNEVLTFPPNLVPGGELLGHIKTVFETTNFVGAFKNTTLLAVTNTTLILFFDSLAGFAFAKYKFRGKKLLFSILMATMMIPGQLTLVPSYSIMDKLGWINSYKALIIPGMANAFGIFWIKQYAEDAIPDSLIESAYIDGASNFRIYRSIVLPILRPSLAFLGIYTFMGTWNDYMWPLIVLNDQSKFTLMLELAQLKGLYSVDYSLVMAGTLLATIPLLVIFLFGSKQLIAGLTAGAVKD
ncbi:carbohydrate ABC transporter permease [Enterococcus sp. AZ194]|uniref:carbohydrate ABC transporter permease n=1 Tax=Enterococcus sp. AZ194 TaxID=2774629 RepID=UPI003F684A2A